MDPQFPAEPHSAFGVGIEGKKKSPVKIGSGDGDCISGVNQGHEQ